jgi:hypothetical protein
MFGPGVISISNDVKENETAVDGETAIRSNIRAEYRVSGSRERPWELAFEFSTIISLTFVLA